MTVPYLTLPQRIEYLCARNYMPGDQISEAASASLARTNFHYFLGYARNHRALVGRGKAAAQAGIDHVFDLITLDQAVSACIFKALQKYEWLLRAAIVEQHCKIHPPTGCFVEEEHYQSMGIANGPTFLSVRSEILRSREPYVVEQFEAHELKAGRLAPRSAGEMSEDAQDAVLRTIPIWAVVDGWSLGLASRVIMESKPADDDATLLWKQVANSFEVSNSIFDTQLRSMVVLRNQVAHHARLWMRPTANSPKLPKLYKKRGDGVHEKSMYVACLALAAFLKPSGHDKDFLDELDALLDSNPLYKLGFTSPVG